MSQPTRWKSHDAATSAGAGESERTKAHDKLGFWVLANGIDPANDTLEVRLEASADDTHYAPIDRGAPNVDDVFYVTAADLTQSDADSTVYVEYVGGNSFPVEYIRANIVTHSGGFEVTTIPFLQGWTSRGVAYDRPLNV